MSNEKIKQIALEVANPLIENCSKNHNEKLEACQELQEEKTKSTIKPILSKLNVIEKFVYGIILGVLAEAVIILLKFKG